MTIGQRIKLKREELVMSQEDLALKIGYKSKSSINKIELGVQKLTQTKIKAIADALCTTTDYIMGWDEELAQKEKELCDLFSACHGQEAYTIVQLFLELDMYDRARIRERIETMLESDKYRGRVPVLSNA